MPKLSIIIPIYNVEQYLAGCLDSVLSPLPKDTEILLVDDGSTDGSPAIAEEYARRFPSLVRLIRQENRGLGGARNTGIEAAEGDFLFFLDSDDTLAPGAVEEMLQALASEPDLLIFDYVCVGEDGRELDYQSGCARKGRFTLADDPQLIFELPSACNKLWRRRLFTESGIRFPERLWFEDLATTPRLYLRTESVEAVNRPWLRYLQRAGSITKAKNPARNGEIITALAMVDDDYRAMGCRERYGRELEILAVKHQLLASTVRVNLADPKSPVQAELLADLNRRFPDWRNNPYLPGLPRQHRLLLRLIDGGHYGAVHTLMTANNLLKGKKM